MKKRLIALSLAVILVLSGAMMLRISAEATEFGDNTITGTLDTDKEAYQAGEDIKVTLSLTGKADMGIEGIFVVPQGLTLKSGSTDIGLDLVTDVPQSAVITLIKNKETVATGTGAQLTFWTAALIASLGGLLILAAKGKIGRRALFILIAAATAGAMMMPVKAVVKYSYTVNKVFTVDGTSYTVTAMFNEVFRD